MINIIKNYFTSRSSGDETQKAPEGVCPDCWGKQEWEDEFYKKIKANNITPENSTLKEDIYTCETCNVSCKN